MENSELEEDVMGSSSAAVEEEEAENEVDAVVIDPWEAAAA